MSPRNRLYYLLVGMQFGIAIGSAISWLVYAALSRQRALPNRDRLPAQACLHYA